MTTAPDILQKIIRHKQELVAAQKQSLSLMHLQRQVDLTSPVRGFVKAIKAQVDCGKPAIIAEIKRASPSKGIIRENYDPAFIAQTYEKNGATALSVLTDIDFFCGSDEHLQQARAVCELPVLRKDFIIDAYQIYHSRLLGADCILLIVAALRPSQLHDFAELANELNLDVLVEVHDEAELNIALELPTKLIGINNRDLRTFHTQLETTFDLAAKIPANKIVVTESGISTRTDILRMQQHNVNAFLIGETFMRAADPGEKLAEMLNAE